VVYLQQSNFRRLTVHEIQYKGLDTPYMIGDAWSEREMFPLVILNSLISVISNSGIKVMSAPFFFDWGHSPFFRFARGRRHVSRGIENVCNIISLGYEIHILLLFYFKGNASKLVLKSLVYELPNCRCIVSLQEGDCWIWDNIRPDAALYECFLEKVHSHLFKHITSLFIYICGIKALYLYEI
jgi:hypothetical protein